MKSLDRMIKRERNSRYRLIRKAFKARDAASKYVDMTMRVSVIMDNLGDLKINQLSNKHLAKLLIDASFMKPPPPPPRYAKPGIIKPPEPPQPIPNRRNRKD